VIADPGGQDEVLGEFEVTPPVRDGPLDVTLADQVDEPPVGAVGVTVGLEGRGECAVARTDPCVDVSMIDLSMDTRTTNV
jgi:hypothetical protein